MECHATPPPPPAVQSVAQSGGVFIHSPRPTSHLEWRQPVFSDTYFDAHRGDTDKYDNLARKLNVEYLKFLSQHQKVSGTSPTPETQNPEAISQSEVLPWRK
jgi:hypothetical protein